MEVSRKRPRAPAGDEEKASRLVWVNCAALCVQKVNWKGRAAYTVTVCRPENGTGVQELVGTFCTSAAAHAAFAVAKSGAVALPPEIEACRLRSRLRPRRAAAALQSGAGQGAAKEARSTPPSPRLAATYADDIFEHFCAVEDERRPSAAYLSRQRDINPKMRTILVDWPVCAALLLVLPRGGPRSVCFPPRQRIRPCQNP